MTSAAFPGVRSTHVIGVTSMMTRLESPSSCLVVTGAMATQEQHRSEAFHPGPARMVLRIWPGMLPNGSTMWWALGFGARNTVDIFATVSAAEVSPYNHRIPMCLGKMLS